jgi:tetrapyrrole methylase family protein/MazG family protein
LLYAVPGHPLVAERTVQLLLQAAEETDVSVEIAGGTSFLDPLFTLLRIDPIEGFSLLDGTALSAEQLDPRLHILIGQVYDRFVASDVKLTLMEVYPDDHPVTVVTAAGIPRMQEIRTVPLHELDHSNHFTDWTSVYVPPVREESALYRRFDYLAGVIARLRGPDGCPWDRKQTHESLRPYLLEETYEFLDAVAEGDVEAMAEELGDILLQVLLHAQIASEEGFFDIRDVVAGLTDKMIRRHPHVFGDAKVETADEVNRNWEEIKQKEKGEKPVSVLSGIPSQFPALLKAYELSKKAAKVGFDWEKKGDVFRKAEEELAELSRAESDREREEELGDLLFVAVNLARFLKVNPELALLGACRKFERRFRHLEEKAYAAGKKLEELSMREMDAWWEEAKAFDKGCEGGE